MRPVIAGLAGGSGAGKTTIVRGVVQALGEGRVAVIEYDCYYRDQRYLPLEVRQYRNYDHPDAFETSLLIAHMEELRQGRPVQVPIYDFSTHTRAPSHQVLLPASVIIVEGILVLADAALRRMLDLRVFVEANTDTRLARRLYRDTQERGRSIDSVLQQYRATVQPMHEQFVEPSRAYADLVLSGTGDSRICIELLAARLRLLLAE